MSSAVTITTSGTTISASTPYDPAFVKRAKQIGGRWNGASKTWDFDARDETRVRELCRTIYGSDGTATAGPTVSVRVPVTDAYEEFRVAGRRLAYRPGRDDSVRYDDGVVLVAGGFPSSGGSVKNPRMEPRDGTVLEVRDVPMDIAQRMVKEVDGAQIVDDAFKVREGLLAERARLVTRLAEIDTALAEVE